MKKVIFVLAILLLSTSSIAGSIGFYYGNTDIDSLGANVGTLNIALGGELSKNASMEARLGVGVKDEEIGSTSIGAGLSIGTYLKLGPTEGAVNPYFLLGYTVMKVEYDSWWYNDSDTESDTSFGVGLNFNTSENTSIVFEALKLVEDVDSINVAFIKRF